MRSRNDVRIPLWVWWALFVVALLANVVVAHAQTTTFPSQNLVLENSQTTAVAGAATKTLAAVTNSQHHVYGVSAFCSAGTATLSITDGGTTIWSTPSGAVGTGIFAVAWTPAPLTGSRNAAVVISLTSCGGGNTGTLNIQADRY